MDEDQVLEVKEAKNIGEDVPPSSLGEGGSWLDLNLSEEKLQEITDNILEEVDNILNERRPIESKIKQYRNQYDQIVADNALPFPSAFNLCYHKDVEVLTKEGWKFIKDVQVGEQVISREPLTGIMKYQPVIAKQEFKNIDRLIRFKHRSFEICVTEDHNMYTEDKSGKRYKFIKAKDFIKPKGGSVGIPSAGKWDAEEAIEFFGFDADTFLEFLGWYLSEGCVFKSGTIAIAQCIPRKRELIKKCLDRMGVRYTERETIFLVSLPPGLVTHLRCLGKAWEKFIPRFYLDLPPRQLRILFDSMVSGDGHITKRKHTGREDRISYTTTSKRLADDMQELILKLGYSASIRDRNNIGRKTMLKIRPFNPCISRHMGYDLEVRYREYFDLRRMNKEYINYNDTVYCLTTEPYHIIYVRQKGKAIWCGQCVPTTAKNVDACVSQTEEAFEEVDPKWSIQMPPGKDMDSARETHETILDYYSDLNMEETEAWTKVYQDAFLLGTGWLAMVFRRDFLNVKRVKEYFTVQQFMNDFPKSYVKYPKYLERLANNEMVRLVVDKKEEIVYGPKPEHIEWEDVIVPLATNGLEGMLKTPLAGRRLMKRWSEIKELEDSKDYISGVSEKLKEKIGGNAQNKEIDPEYMKKDFETYEIMYFVDIDGDGIPERCLFNISVEHKLCLRAVRYPYHHNRPFLTPYYIQCTRKGIYQPGLGEKLQNINIALNATINHVLNASVIANSLSLKVRSGTDAVRALYEHQWYPGSILELMNVEDVQQFTFNTPNLSSLINLFAIIERFGQDVSGIVNYLMGQESSDDPEAPASKTIALMRKSEIKLRRYIKTLKRSNNEVAYQALQLIYQYIPVERLVEAVNIDESEIIKAKNMPFQPITQSTGFAIEKIFEKRDNQSMTQMLLSDPVIQQDVKRRLRLYRINAKDFGSNWDKKVEQILPSEEEIDQMQQQAQTIQQQSMQRKIDVIKRATQEALSRGASPEEAKQIGLSAGEKFMQTLQQGAQESGNQQAVGQST